MSFLSDMATLWEITQEFLSLASIIEEAGGEATDELMEHLAINRDSFSHKAEGYSKLILKWESEIDTASAEIKRIQAIKKTKENSVARLKETLLHALTLYGRDGKWETPLMKLSTRRSVAVEIVDETELPDAFFVVKKEASKTAIGNALKAGEEVPGAFLKENVSLQIK
jgi:hypothetical protein